MSMQTYLIDMIICISSQKQHRACWLFPLHGARLFLTLTTNTVSNSSTCTLMFYKSEHIIWGFVGWGWGVVSSWCWWTCTLGVDITRWGSQTCAVACPGQLGPSVPSFSCRRSDNLGWNQKNKHVSTPWSRDSVLPIMKIYFIDLLHTLKRGTTKLFILLKIS